MAVHGFLLERVSVVRDEATVLRQVSAHFPAGRCSAVRGASGSGKTTLLRLLNRLIDPTSGKVWLDGVPLTDLDVLVLRRRVGLVAQAPVVLTDAVLNEVRVGRPDLPEGRVTELLARLCLGQSAREAFLPHQRSALRTALIPAIDSTKVVGLISLPVRCPDLSWPGRPADRDPLPNRGDVPAARRHRGGSADLCTPG